MKPKTIQYVRVELDITPSWWGKAGKILYGLAVETVLNKAPSIFEVRASRQFLRVLAEVPADDVPIMSLARLRADLFEAAEPLMPKATHFVRDQYELPGLTPVKEVC